MLVFLLLVYNFYATSSEVFGVINKLNSIFEDTEELNTIYKSNKNTGYYIFEESEVKFWGKEFEKLHDILINDDSLSDSYRFQIYLNEFSFCKDKNVDRIKFLSEIKEICDGQNVPKICNELKDLENIKNNTVYKIKKENWHAFYEGRIRKLFVKRNKNIKTHGKVFIFSNSEIDTHLMMLSYKTLSRRMISHFKNSDENSLLVFLSLNFKDEDGKSNFYNKISDMYFAKEINKKDDNLLKSYGLFGFFSNIEDNIRFNIKTIFMTNDFLPNAKDEFESLVSVLEMVQLKKKFNYDLVSKRIGFLIKRYNCNNSDLGKLFYDKKPKRAIYEITNYISDRNEHKEISFIIRVDNIKYVPEKKDLTRITVIFLKEFVLNSFLDICRIKDNINLKDDAIDMELKSCYYPKLEREIFFNKAFLNKYFLENLNALIEISVKYEINPYITALRLDAISCLDNNLVFISHEPLSFLFAYKNRLTINDAIKSLVEKLLYFGQKYDNGYTENFYIYDYIKNCHFPLCKKLISDKYYLKYDLKSNIRTLIQKFKIVDRKNFDEMISTPNRSEFLFSLDDPNNICKKIFFHLNIYHLYVELYKKEFNKNIKDYINSLSSCKSNENKLNLQLFISKEYRKGCEGLKSKLCQFFNSSEIYNNIIICDPRFYGSIKEIPPYIVKLFVELTTPVSDPDCLNKYQLEDRVKWLRNVIVKISSETNSCLNRNVKFNNIEIEVSLFTPEPYTPDVLYAIQHSILSEK